MIKYFCDRCEKDMPNEGATVIINHSGLGNGAIKRNVTANVCDFCVSNLKGQFKYLHEDREMHVK